jgi:hypothetical protein
MKAIRRILVWAVVLAVAFVGAIYGASELGGEIVTLRTRDGGREVATRLWVVDDGGFQYLRAGDPSSGWLQRIELDPEIVVERNGVATRYRGVPVIDDPAQPARIHERMREKYGFADRIVSLLGDRSLSVAVRLVPLSSQSGPPAEEP